MHFLSLYLTFSLLGDGSCTSRKLAAKCLLSHTVVAEFIEVFLLISP